MPRRRLWRSAVAVLFTRGRLGYGAAVVYVFTTAVHTSIPGALLTFARGWNAD